MEEVDEVGFHFDVTALKFKEKLTDCDAICEFLKIPQDRFVQLYYFAVLFFVFVFEKMCLCLAEHYENDVKNGRTLPKMNVWCTLT